MPHTSAPSTESSAAPNIHRPTSINDGKVCSVNDVDDDHMRIYLSIAFMLDGALPEIGLYQTRDTPLHIIEREHYFKRFNDRIKDAAVSYNNCVPASTT